MTSYSLKPTLSEIQIDLLIKVLNKRIGEIFVESSKNVHGYFDETKELEKIINALKAENCEIVLRSYSNFKSEE